MSAIVAGGGDESERRRGEHMTGGFGGIVSFAVRGGRDDAARAVSRLRIPRAADDLVADLDAALGQ